MANWKLTTSGAAIAKAGSKANATIVASSATLLKWSDDVEGTINTITRKDWVADYANVTTNFKGILSELASDMIAMKIVAYDLSGYTSRTEGETILDVLRDSAVRNIEILKEEKNKEVMD